MSDHTFGAKAPVLLPVEPHRSAHLLRRLLRLVVRVVAVLLVVAVLAAAWVAWAWYGSIPDRDTAHAVPGLGAPVEVRWDARGVPHVRAGSFEDALRAEGFLHGLLRPFQVELRRRAVRSELAAFAGERALPLDEDALRAGFVARAAADEAALAPGERRAAEAYLEGLNAGLARAARTPQLRVARLAAEPWTLRDVLAFARRFASTLTDTGDREAARFAFVREVGPETASTLWQAAWGEPLPLPAATRDLLARAAVVPVAGGAAGSGPAAFDEEAVRASNAWAVAPSRSARGGALLAGDPHLDFELPTTWFPAVLEWPGGQLAGASLAGAPGILIGHNADVAWSFTVANFDETDLFLAEVDDVEAPTRVRENGAWRALELERHAVRAKGEATGRTVVVRRAGPAVYVGPSGLAGIGLLERSASRESGGLLASLLAIGRARGVDEAVAAARRFPGPGFNFVVAGRDGTVAHAVVGTVPERREDGWDGALPVPWRGPGSWAGFRPPAAMPLARNPVGGYVHSANEPGLAGAAGLPGDYAAPWRALRIAERLAALPRARAEDMRALQLDAQAGAAPELRAEIAGCGIDSPAAQAYAAWDGQLQGTGAALLHPLLRHAVISRFREHTRLGTSGGAAPLGQLRSILRLVREARDNPWLADWLDDPGTAWDEPPCELLRRALDDAWRAAGRDGDPAHRAYAAAHRLALRSPVGVGMLARWFDPAPEGLDGSADSVLAQAERATPATWAGGPLEVYHGPSFRLVVDFAEGRPRSLAMLPGGVDEHPGSPHAWDQLAPWAQGEMAPFADAPLTDEVMTLK